MCQKKNRKRQTGQIGIIILLIMSVLLTVGLSLAANINRDLVLTQQETDSARVFNAAEAGIEDALSSELTFGDSPAHVALDTINRVDVEYDVTSVRTLETRIPEAKSIEIDLTGAVDGNSLQIEWAHETSCTSKGVSPASLLVSIFYVDANGDTRVRYQPIGGCDWGDGFSVAGSGSGAYTKAQTITLQTDDLFARIKALYNDTHIKISGVGWTLPYQGFVIRSTAQSQTGNETRVVEVNRTLPTAPTFMDYAIYSGTTIDKR